ncbi:MAG: AAA family ATPase [Alcaligenes nematophilus]|uniref:AAA family ATPase n=1 Tax=Alcaligenes nematophilus TaxID=2994643 RepID=UPI003D01D79B
MIKDIVIQGYKSFHPTTPVTITLETATQKPVFFYGLNGAGKTAIGEVIHGHSLGDADFHACRVETTQGGPFRYLVYNHHFVQSVIGEAEGMPGIFTMGELDTQTQRQIEEHERLLHDVRIAREAAQRDISRINGELATALNDAKESVWATYKAHDKGVFDNFLTGYGRGAQKFFDDLRKYEVPDDEVLDDLDNLAKRLGDISGDETLKGTHHFSVDAFLVIEKDSIWRERVEVSGESRLASLVERLGNGDWVSKGRAFVHDDHCPFCQQELPHGFLGDLAKLLDGDRQQKIDLIETHVLAYESSIQTLEESVNGALAEPLSQETDLQAKWDATHALLKANLATMRLKQATPAEPVEIALVDMLPLQEALSALNTRIGAFNKRIQNKVAEHKAIRDEFWKNMWRDRVDVYRAYDARIAPLGLQLAAAKTADQEAGARETHHVGALTELRKKQEGVDASVASINDRLKGLGIDSFSIARKPGEGSLYCLERPAHGESSAQSLSEGEKTLISFLYFIELLKGSKEQGASVDIGKTIVVIDDPISSLSHNFVYDIASMICHELIRPPGGQKVRQVIVLTHNLFFLHELVYQIAGSRLAKAGEKCQLIRVVKSEHSRVVPMDARDFANDYDALWHVMQDAKEGSARIQVVPNTMRCILENFFAFTGNTKQFEEILKQLSLEDGAFRPLERFLNRGSHRDETNIAHIDWGQFDISYYLGKLEAVFKAAGHPDHYRLKMGLPDPG